MDLIGEKYCKLTVIEQREKLKNKGHNWLCLCECGKETVVNTSNLRQGHTRSCGCIRNTHSMTKTRPYNIYRQMLERCKNPNHASYVHYGGRGIKACEEWSKSFEAFWSDMEEGYVNNLTLDRIDNDKGYSKENCRWVTMKVQANNSRHNVYLEFNGEVRTIREWSKIVGIHESVISARKTKGWTDEESLTRSTIRERNILGRFF